MVNICPMTSPMIRMTIKRYGKRRHVLQGSVNKFRVSILSALVFSLLITALCPVHPQVLPRIFFEAISKNIDRSLGIQVTSLGTQEENQSHTISATVAGKWGTGVKPVQENQTIRQPAKITTEHEENNVISGMDLDCYELMSKCECRKFCVFAEYLV